jgi:O-antigen/teichoic acid export membrane protein
MSVIKGTAALVGWNSIGTLVYAINETGINVLLNLFFGPSVNAARAVAYQVNGALKSFISNFYTSIRPQITKSYAANDWDYLYSLFYKSSKYSFFMMWIISLPVFFVAKDVLNIWLKEVPEYTDSFLIWILICSLITVLNTPVWTLALAVGKLKKYTIIGAVISLLQLPISYVGLKLGFSPNSVFVVMILVNAINIFANTVIIHSHVSFSYKGYVSEVLKPILKITFLTLIIDVVISKILDGNIFVLVIFVLVSFIQVAIGIWFMGLDRNERNFVKKIIINRIKTFREKS